MDSETCQTKNILIVGDWVVDEYWFLLKHNSKIGSFTGLTHLRSASKRGDITSDLCGAGHIARCLFELKSKYGLQISITGIGLWDRNDTEYLKHLIHSRIEKKNCDACSIGFSVTTHYCTNPPDIELIPLLENCSTNRVIRQYRHNEDGLSQINRIDWGTHNQEQELSYPNLPSIIKPPDYIFIQDLNKGAVTDKLINSLLNSFPQSYLCIRTKNRNQKWLPNIPKEKILINIIGPEMIKISPRESWLINGEMTKEAYEFVKRTRGKNVVLISDQNEIIVKTGSLQQCNIGISDHSVNSILHLGWSTAISSLLLAQLIKNDKTEISKEDLSFSINEANNFSGIPIPDSMRSKTSELIQPRIFESNWRISGADWKRSKDTSQYGIIMKNVNGTNIKQLDVWRASPILPGYITIVQEKQKIIRNIYQKLKEFKQSQDQTRSLSILLQADPGAGKTYLAKCLARDLDFDLVRYDITQMMHREDLLDLFETVATRQARNQKKILVFVDEINARLDGDQVFGAFLTPLEENFYIHHGKNFSIQPCVWIFTGTKTEKVEFSPSDKYADFISRMSVIEKMDYASLIQIVGKSTLEKEARLEQVYLGASLIKSTLPDINEVSEQILKIFYRINPEENSVRKIRKLVSTVENLQFGELTIDNCSRWPEIIEEIELDTEPIDRQLIRLII